MWALPESYSGKRIWLEKHFGESIKKRLILSHRKDLLMGDYLIDDRLRHGVTEFKGEHIHFGTDKFPDWEAVLDYLLVYKAKW
jgi:5'(3')-deoxyribonucleotidase